MRSFQRNENLNNSSGILRKAINRTVINYRGISLLPKCYKVLSNVLGVYVDEIIEEHQ